MMQTPRLSVALGVGLVFLGIAGVAQAAGWSGVVDFGAKWCGPCRQMAPIVERLRQESLPIRAVDVDEQAELARKHGINSYPTFVLFVDGKEVDRVSGAMSEADLRRYLDRVPLAKVTENQNLMGVDLGEAGAIPASARPSVPRPAEQPVQLTRVAEAEPDSPGKKLWPFGSKKDSSPTIRGNDDTVALGASQEFPGPAGVPFQKQVVVGDPMAASARIRVTVGDHVNLGSGTVISSSEGNSLILTCGHIFRGFGKDCKIEVDLFENGKPRTIVARLEKYDLESDLGLIAIATPEAIPMVKVASPKEAPKVGMPVACIGCSGGDDPTRDQIRVTDVDKYEGPNNIECTGIPVQGRSGGGLFDADGRLVGVCIASDPKEQRGLYSGLFAVHELLNRCELAHLYQEPVPAAAIASAPVDIEAQPFSRVDSPAMPAAEAIGQPVAAAPRGSVLASSTQPNSVAVDSAGAEAVIILKDNDHPDQPHRVVIIHQVSPSFMNYLNGELDSPVRGADTVTSTPDAAGVRVAETSPLPMFNRPLRGSEVTEPLPYVQRRTKAELAPTSLSRPRVQAYVRSAASR